MGKPKNDWYPRAVQLIRLYPTLSSRRDSLDGGRITPSYGASQGRCSQAARTVEAMVLGQLSPIDDLSLDIVQRAIDDMQSRPYGDLTMEVIQHVDWDRDCTLEEIQRKLPISYSTARRYRNRFVKLVAKNAGWFSYV